MHNKIKKIFTAKTWLGILTGICVLMIGITFFTDILTKPLQSLTSNIIIPMQKGVNGIGLWFTEKSELFASVESLQKENAELKDEINELKNENLAMEEDKVELNTLRELYELDGTYSDYDKVGANVIGRSADNWYNTFTIDKGSEDGIKVNMNVIADNGLVGIVTSVSKNHSIVRSIIDDSSNVSAMLLTTSDICTISGDLQLMKEGYISLQYLDKDAKIRDGDMIVTSNISEKYLPGILIGYASNVELDSNSLTKSGYLIPAVDFKQLTTVLVITELKTEE